MTAPPLLLGHRGCRVSRSVPENTFASFDLAIQHGCDGFEFDVRLTADDIPVICHDPKCAGREIAKSTYEQLLQRWSRSVMPKYGRAAAPRKSIGLPRLKEVLTRYGQRAFLDIELKVAGLEPHVLEAVRAVPPEKNYVISSFLPDVLLELRARRSGLCLALICDRTAQLRRWMSLPVDGVKVKERLLTPALIAEAHQAGRKVGVWTVNDATAMRRYAEWGVDCIISDDTELLVGTLRGEVDEPVKETRKSLGSVRRKLLRSKTSSRS